MMGEIIKNIPQNFQKDKLFLEQVMDQVNKNLPYRIAPLEKPLLDNPGRIISALQAKTRQILSDDKINTTQYIYQVDLPENELDEVFSTSFDRSVAVLTSMILQREAEKVYIRWQWKSNINAD